MKTTLDLVIIFGAKYLVFISIAFAIWYLFKQKKAVRRQMLIFGTITMPLTFVLARIFSQFFYNPRPFVVGDFTPLIFHVADNGFPSDHTLLASAVAMLIYYFNKKLGMILLLLASIVGISRVFAGVHHYLDIFGSLFIAAIVAFVYVQLFQDFFLSRIKRFLS